MGNYYLAVDIGASSGRHILAEVKDGRIVLEEIYRFENGMQKKDGRLCWDVPGLFSEIKTGIKKCKELGKIPVSMGIDTWAVDYVLLDKQDRVLGGTYGYRDGRTEGMDRKVYEIIPEEELYGRTGIQKLIFNTVYQLMAVKEEHPEYLEEAESFLMLPDYFHFLLTGNKVSDYTNATSTQLISPSTYDWDYELIERLGYPKKIFRPVSMPGTVVGSFTREMEKELGFSCQVVLPPTHDTASAVLAVPAADEDFIYISSGTWSLMGIESKNADCSMESMKRNFTNEGGYGHRYRFLKNIMGLWMIQSVRHELKDAYSFAELCRMAEDKKDFPSRVDVNADCFLAPENMTEAIREYCAGTEQPVPIEIGEIATVIYQSLAESYAETVKEIEEVTGRRFSRIYIVGGGSNAGYLNELTARATGKEVFAGPTEATAIGNLAAQMIQAEEFTDVEQVRNCIYKSFSVNRV